MAIITREYFRVDIPNDGPGTAREIEGLARHHRIDVDIVATVLQNLVELLGCDTFSVDAIAELVVLQHGDVRERRTAECGGHIVT